MTSGHTDDYRAAAGEFRAGVTAATERLGEIIEVLRDDSDTTQPQPGGDGVAEVVARAAASGVPVELRRDGVAANVPTMVDRAVYRVVQESLTNAAKHAPGAAVVVQLSYATDEVVVTVTNETPSARPEPDRIRPRHGLPGLRERVGLAGGTLQAGHRDDGFEVIARLPYAAGAVVSADVGGATRHAERSPQSGRHLVVARKKARWGLIAAAVIPLMLGAGAMSARMGYQAYTASRSVLATTDFSRLQIGQDRDDVRPVLPARQLPERPPGREPRAPAGAACEYYAVTSDPIDDLFGDAYRLCFADGRLVAKDVLSGVEP